VKELMRDYIRTARWFGGKGRSFEVTGTRRLHLSPDVTVEGEQIMLHHALIGEWDDDELGHVFGYDATHDHAAMALWLTSFAEDSTAGDLSFHRVGDVELDTEARSTLFSGEQSNSSVAFGDDSLMKLFRRVTPGPNPDIEILSALTELGNEHVPALYGWVETTTEDGQVLNLGILQQFLRTASDGWELALASLRNLYADGGSQARESGGDLASEAQRLGEAVAEMHTSLVKAFPTESWGQQELAALSDAMVSRLEAATEVVPELEPHGAALRGIFDAVRRLDRPVTAQRIHGDLHLGQTLRTVKNWKIIDFEGEPAKSLEERRRPDSPWRDVAGMLRSFDYAAELSRVDHAHAAGDAEENDAELARGWTSRNRTAFLVGYRDASGHDVDEALLKAYAADKAVYEAVYEARNRPAWLPIPLAALSRMASQI
jgi:maltokinase